MSTPDSLNPAPLTSLGDQSSRRLFEDDYSTGKLNLKLKASTQGQGSANYKGWLDLKKKTSQQETKFQFQYNRYFFLIATRLNEVKIHTDFGRVFEKDGKSANLFANAKFSSPKFTDGNIRLGAVTKCEKQTSHFRLEYNQQTSQTVNFLARSQWKVNNWVVVAAKEFQLTGFGIKRYDLLVGYIQPKYDVFVRHLTNNTQTAKPLSQVRPDRLLTDLVFRNKGQTYGAEVEYNLAKNSLTAQVAASTKQNGVDIKGRVNLTNLTLGLSGKGKFNDRFSWTLSTELPLNGSKPQSQGVFPVPVGFTLEATL